MAPVVVFAYRRPDHLRKTLTALKNCAGFENSPVVVFCDGPRCADEQNAVAATRDVARTMLGDRAEYHFGEENQGLARSVIAGVSDVLGRFGRAIVVEDDLEVSEDFLTYMNSALERFADETDVFQISAYMFDVPGLRGDQSAMFLPITVSWGWATWQRAWERFDPRASGWEELGNDPVLRRRFNLDGAYDYATMLSRQMQGLKDSWAVRWYWTVFKANGLVLFPPRSLVRNIGFDGSGTHGRGRLRRFSAEAGMASLGPIVLPDDVRMDREAYRHVREGIWRQNGGWIAWALDWVRRLLRR